MLAHYKFRFRVYNKYCGAGGAVNHANRLTEAADAGRDDSGACVEAVEVASGAELPRLLPAL